MSELKFLTLGFLVCVALMIGCLYALFTIPELKCSQKKIIEVSKDCYDSSWFSCRRCGVKLEDGTLDETCSPIVGATVCRR